MIEGVEALIAEEGTFAIVRAKRSHALVEAAHALREGGIRCLEVTMTTPGALAAIEAMAEALSDVTVGAGSVMDAETTRRVIGAGARFVLSPALVPEVVTTALSLGALPVPGAYTPTEVHHARVLGAPLVKIFPADRLGPSYVAALLAPMPDLRLVPTGGVTLENVGEWLRAGSFAVGIGSALVNDALLETGELGELRRRAGILRANIERARAPRPVGGLGPREEAR